jgi:hypothetical protein
VPSLIPLRRPLSIAERRLIRSKIGGSDRRQRTVSKRVPVAALGIILLLWLATLLASDAPWAVITVFWLIVGAVIGLWLRHDQRKDDRHVREWAQGLESALRRNEAEVFDIRARAFVELEEFEDEGACYAFELDEGRRVVFVSGQEFYEAARFPSLDFSLVYALDEEGRPADMLIEKRGPKAAPARTMPFAVKHAFEIPEHLEVVEGPLDQMEARLRVRVESGR